MIGEEVSYHTTLIHALDVVGHPGDGIGDAWIDSKRSEESS